MAQVYARFNGKLHASKIAAVASLLTFIQPAQETPARRSEEPQKSPEGALEIGSTECEDALFVLLSQGNSNISERSGQGWTQSSSPTEAAAQERFNKT